MSRKSNRFTIPKKQVMRLHLKCPNCQAPTRAYKVTPRCATLTELTQECTNPMCRMEFISYSQADRILHPPKVLFNPSIGREMKLSKLARSRRMSDTMDAMALADNDEDLEELNNAIPQGDLFYTLLEKDDSS